MELGHASSINLKLTNLSTDQLEELRNDLKKEFEKNFASNPRGVKKMFGVVHTLHEHFLEHEDDIKLLEKKIIGKEMKSMQLFDKRDTEWSSTCSLDGSNELIYNVKDELLNGNYYFKVII